MFTKYCRFFSAPARGGFGMIEMIVGAAILSVSILGISSFFRTTFEVSKTTQSAIQGDYLLEEGVEVIKILRDSNYTNNISRLSTTTPSYLVWNGTNWATSTVNTFIDGTFERSIAVADVKRDINSDISGSGSYDPNTKLVTVSVAWSAKGATTTRTIATYIANLFMN